MSYPKPPSEALRLEACMYHCGCDPKYCSTIQPRIYAVVPCTSDNCSMYHPTTEDGKNYHHKNVWAGTWGYDDEYDELNAEGKEACKHYGIETDEFDDW